MSAERRRSRPVKTWRNALGSTGAAAPGTPASGRRFFTVGTVSAALVILAAPAALWLLATREGSSLGFRDGMIIVATALVGFLLLNMHVEQRWTGARVLVQWLFALPVGLVAISPWLGTPGLLFLPGAAGVLFASARTTHRHVMGRKT